MPTLLPVSRQSGVLSAAHWVSAIKKNAVATETSRAAAQLIASLSDPLLDQMPVQEDVAGEMVLPANVKLTAEPLPIWQKEKSRTRPRVKRPITVKE